MVMASNTIMMSSSPANNGDSQPTGSKPVQKNSFPYKLYRLLESLSGSSIAAGQTSTTAGESIAWLPHGRAFMIRNQKHFVEHVIPVHFKQTKIRSFVRQLHLWEFKR
jgi:hypothetical protein